MRNAFVALLFVSFAFSGCIEHQQRLDFPPRETVLATDRVELPAIFIKGRPYVDLKVNGKGPFRFLVDTGSLGSCVTPQVAREAGILTSNKYTTNVIGASGEIEKQFTSIVDRMESPGFVVSVVAVAILTPESVTLMDHQGERANGGILGLSTLRDVRLEIDYPQHKISVVRLGQGPRIMESGVPYTGDRPHVTIAISTATDAATTALIDTGAEGGVELADISRYPTRVGLVKADHYTFGIGGYWRPLFGQLAGDIHLGTAIWRDPEIRSAIKNRIGGNALSSWKVVIDQKRKWLWLLDENQMVVTTWSGPLEADGRPAVYGFAFLPDGDSFVAKEVDPGSRAERAGLKVGDRLVSENPDLITADQNRAPAAGALRLHVVRGSEQVEIILPRLDSPSGVTKSASGAPTETPNRRRN